MACLNPIFSSHMVFARRKPIRIFGTGRGEVEVSFAGRCQKAVSDENFWEVEFPPMEYGGPYTLSFRTDGEETVLEDVFVGEVLLMSGQSNMQFRLKNSSFPAQEYCGNSNVRIFYAPSPNDSNAYAPKDGWIVSTQENAPEWSALSYLVGHLLQKEKNVAIGLIACCQGASVIESWLPKGTTESLGIRLSSEEKSMDHELSRYFWNKDADLYDHSLSCLFPFSLSSVVWYQGESDFSVEESRVYKQELDALIRIWRTSFRDESLPFVVIQIADYVNRLGEAWSNIQKAQYEIQFELPQVKTVCSADVSERDDIHPPTKIHLARRIVTAFDELLCDFS